MTDRTIPLIPMGKPWYASKTIWGVLMLVPSVAAAVLHTVGAATGNAVLIAIAEALDKVGSIVGAPAVPLAIYGRVTATEQIG